jgi:hypothetical protein
MIQTENELQHGVQMGCFAARTCAHDMVLHAAEWLHTPIRQLMVLKVVALPACPSSCLSFFACPNRHSLPRATQPQSRPLLTSQRASTALVATPRAPVVVVVAVPLPSPLHTPHLLHLLQHRRPGAHHPLSLSQNPHRPQFHRPSRGPAVASYLVSLVCLAGKWLLGAAGDISVVGTVFEGPIQGLWLCR